MAMEKPISRIACSESNLNETTEWNGNGVFDHWQMCSIFEGCSTSIVLIPSSHINHLKSIPMQMDRVADAACFRIWKVEKKLNYFNFPLDDGKSGTRTMKTFFVSPLTSINWNSKTSQSSNSTTWEQWQDIWSKQCSGNLSALQYGTFESSWVRRGTEDWAFAIPFIVLTMTNPPKAGNVLIEHCNKDWISKLIRWSSDYSISTLVQFIRLTYVIMWSVLAYNKFESEWNHLGQFIP